MRKNKLLRMEDSAMLLAGRAAALMILLSLILTTSGYAATSIELTTGNFINVFGNLNLSGNNLINAGNVSIRGNLSVDGNFSVDGSTLFVDSNSNRVGIGTTSPGAHLTIYDPANTEDGQKIRLGFDSVTDYSIWRNTATGYLHFNGSQTGFIGYVFNSGNVGIGNTNPAQPLVVAGAINSTIVIANGGSTPGDQAGIEFNFNNGRGANTGNIARIMGNVVSGGGGDILFQTAPNTTGSYATQMTLLRGGNVGIGTTSPGYTLTVTDTGTTTAVNLSDVLFVDASNNRVGIGNATPQTKLSVTAGGPQTQLSAINAVGGVASFLSGQGSLGVSDNTSILTLYHNRDDGSENTGSTLLNLFTNADDSVSPTQPLMRIVRDVDGAPVTLFNVLHNGNVGIGTTNPQYLLQVADTTGSGLSMNVSDILYVNGSSGYVGIGTAGPQAKLDVVGTSGNPIILRIKSNQGGSQNVTLFLRPTGTGQSQIAAYADTDMVFGEGSTDPGAITSPHMVIKASTGNVGIGTTNPTALGGEAPFIEIEGANPAIHLDDNGDSDWLILNSGGVFLLMNGSNNEKIRIQQDGNVGIGTTSPSTLLHLQNSADAVLTINGTCANCAGAISLQSGSNNFGHIMSDRELRFATNTKNTATNVRMTIDSSGNVGIGTTGPGQLLHVSGGNVNISASEPILYIHSTRDDASTASQTYRISVTAATTSGTNQSLSFVDTTADASRMVITPAGNVGIGTTSPGMALHVVGSVNVSGSIRIATNNFFQSYNAAGTARNVLAYNPAGFSDSTVLNNADSGGITLAISEIAKLTVANSGNVGIGNTIPNVTLGVSGNVNVSGRLSYGTLAANSPHFLETAGQAEPVCMKANDNKYVGCMPSLKNGRYRWACRVDERCNRKFLDAKLSEEIAKLNEEINTITNETNDELTSITGNAVNEEENSETQPYIKEKIQKLNEIKDGVKSRSMPVKEAVQRLKLEQLKYFDINEVETEEKEFEEEEFAGQLTRVQEVNGSVIIRLG